MGAGKPGPAAGAASDLFFIIFLIHKPSFGLATDLPHGKSPPF